MAHSHKKKVLIFTDWYYPGYKAGGPIQSCHNIVRSLSGIYDFYIITSDRDLGAAKPYPGIQVNEWTRSQYQEQVLYCTPGFMMAKNIRPVVKALRPDVVYFNSMFSQRYTLLPLLMLRRLRYKGKVVLAPRGMLHAGAMLQKGIKKRIFLRTFRLTGWPAKIVFHATDGQEENDISRYFPLAKETLRADNIPNTAPADLPLAVKQPGELRMIFISRLHRKKNLHHLLEILAREQFDGQLLLDVFGESEDDNYFRQLQALVAALPAHIRVSFKGPLPHQKVFETLATAHLFVLPTLGENFGHAIFEALSSGTPVLISEHTPWQNLAASYAGWDIPLAKGTAFAQVIQEVTAMPQAEYENWANGASHYARHFLSQMNIESTYQQLF